jgi:uncharacterized GH25 family protein
MLKKQLMLMALLLAFGPAAQAKDVSAQQAGVEYARQEVDKANAQYKSDLDDVADAEKLLEQRKKAYEQQAKQLADDRKKADLSKKRLQDANVKYSKAQAILDQAWKQ